MAQLCLVVDFWLYLDSPTTIIFSQNITVDSGMHPSAASVYFLSNGSKNSIIVQKTGLFLILCQYQKCTQHWHEIIH